MPKRISETMREKSVPSRAAVKTPVIVPWGFRTGMAATETAISSLRRILKGLSVKEVQQPLLFAGEFDPARLDECEDLGMTMAAGLEAGVF